MLFRSGGLFTSAGGSAANRLARWNGASWTALDSGMNDGVLALLVHDDGSGPALFAGGSFTSAFDSSDSYLAKWGCPDTAPPVITCPSPITVIERILNGPGEVVTFTVTATDDFGPPPVVVCEPPAGSRFPPGTTVVLCTATDTTGKQSSCAFPVTVSLKVRPR